MFSLRTWHYRIAAVVLAAAACVGDGTNLGPDGNPLGTSNPCPDDVCFARDVQPLFTVNCALSGCHAGNTPQQGQNLSAGFAYGSIVDVPSMELAGMRRVRPFLTDSSYLVHKVQGTHLTVGGIGDRMPLGGSPLTAAEIGVIRGWILLGAKNN